MTHAKLSLILLTFIAATSACVSSDRAPNAGSSSDTDDASTTDSSPDSSDSADLTEVSPADDLLSPDVHDTASADGSLLDVGDTNGSDLFEDDADTTATSADSGSPADTTSDSQTSSCQPEQGPCCSELGTLRSNTSVCELAAVRETRCVGDSLCGASIEQRTRDVLCSGTSAQCSGSLSDWSDWLPIDECDQTERCTAESGSCINGTMLCDPRNPDFCTQQLDFTPCDDGQITPPVSEDVCLAGVCRPLSCNDRQCNPTGPSHRLVAGPGRFSVEDPAANGDLVTIDQDTGLWWEHTAIIGTTYSHTSATYRCAELNFAGQSDWRLPDCHEAPTVIDWWRTKPALDPSVFNVHANAWSWTRCRENASTAYALNVSRGDLGTLPTDSTQGAWCVRGSPTATYGPLLPRFTEVDSQGAALQDRATGLIWQVTSPASTQTWAAASQYCQDLTLADLQNWRLPHIDELWTLIDFNRSGSRLAAPFSATQYAWFWTSTQHYNPPNTGSAWQVDLYSAKSQPANKDFPHGVRCVASP